MSPGDVDPADVAQRLDPAFVASMRDRAPEGGPSGQDWLDTLPGLLRDAMQRWSLTTDGPPRYGHGAFVLPCRDDEHGPVALKLGWPHEESRHEHLALRAWAGDGAVRLLAADPRHGTLLLERLEADRPLSAADLDTSCATIGGLLRRLDRPALPQPPTASSRLQSWRRSLGATSTLPPRLVTRVHGLLGELTAGHDERLVHTDLHDGNVLAGGREPWLAIDPKPMTGPPELGVAPLVWNRREEALSAPSTRHHLRWRVETACAAGGLDVDLALAWTLCRCALNAADAPDDHDWVSWQITICSAMQE